MSVKLREKKIKDGLVSFYLDIYHEGNRWYEFLNIKVNSKKPGQEDRDKKRLANEIRSNREHELIVQDNDLIDKRKKNIPFIPYYEKHYKIKDENGKINKDCNGIYRSTFFHIETFAGKKPLSISHISADWLKDFEKYLLDKICDNSAIIYMSTINTVLNEAVRKRIISRNPWHEVARHERLKKQDVFRTALTFEELEMLAQTPFKQEMQIRQAYFFSCFTGLRWSDVNPLRWSEIVVREIDGIERWFLYFVQEKTEGIEYLPISAQAIEILLERKKIAREENDNSPFVFPRVKETNPYTCPVYQRVKRALKTWVKAAKKMWGDKFTVKPENMHFHNARHSFATNMMETGAQGDILLVSKLLGHKSLQCTQKYAHVREQRKYNAVDALPKINLKIVQSADQAAA
jgi:integrase